MIQTDPGIGRHGAVLGVLQRTEEDGIETGPDGDQGERFKLSVQLDGELCVGADVRAHLILRRGGKLHSPPHT